MDFLRSDKLEKVHSDIRGPVFTEAMKMRAAGIDVLRLNSGNPPLFGFTMPDSIRHAVLDNFDKALAYSDVKGMIEAREAILKYDLSKGFHDITIDNIFVGNGVSELVSIAITAVINHGDEVLIPCPDYSLWTNATWIAGATPVHYMCDEQSHWFPDIADIRKKITPNTRAIVLINPNNPTGVLYSKDILEEIIAVARENNLIIFADEIYDRLVMDGKEHVSVASLTDDVVVITTNGLSKSHVACGFRCGWMTVTGPKGKYDDLLDGIFQLCSMRICANAIMQLTIPAALADTESTNDMLLPGGRIYEQREATCRELEKIPGISFVKNDACFYVFPKLDVKRFNITSDEQFAMDYLHAKNVMIIPGRGFSWPVQDHFRIVMLPDKDKITKAISDLGDFLSTYHQA